MLLFHHLLFHSGQYSVPGYSPRSGTNCYMYADGALLVHFTPDSSKIPFPPSLVSAKTAELSCFNDCFYQKSGFLGLFSLYFPSSPTNPYLWDDKKHYTKLYSEISDLSEILLYHIATLQFI